MKTTDINRTLVQISNVLVRHITTCRQTILKDTCLQEHREAFLQRLNTLEKCHYYLSNDKDSLTLNGAKILENINVTSLNGGIHLKLPSCNLFTGHETLVVLKDSLYRIVIKNTDYNAKPVQLGFYAEIISPFEHIYKCSSNCNAILLGSIILLEELK